jgi:hypothetical protein
MGHPDQNEWVRGDVGWWVDVLFLRGKNSMNRTVKFAAVLGVAVWMSALVSAQSTGVQAKAAATAKAAVTSGAPAATLTINTDKTVAKASPTLYGLMTEEINYSYEGGLYGELVQDRTFVSQ